MVSVLAVLPGTMLFLMGVMVLGIWLSPWAMDYLFEHEIFFIPVAGLLIGYFVPIYLLDRRMKRRIAKRRQQLRPARRPGPEEPPGLRSRGTIAPLAEMIPAHLGQEQCVASSLELPDASGRLIYLRLFRAVEFLVKREDGELLVVSGELLLHGTSPTHRLAPEETPALLKRVLPGLHWSVPASAQEHLLQEGDHVELISEEPRPETVTEMARGYRDSAALVVRGERGRPIYIRPLPAA